MTDSPPPGSKAARLGIRGPITFPVDDHLNRVTVQPSMSGYGLVPFRSASGENVIAPMRHTLIVLDDGADGFPVLIQGSTRVQVTWGELAGRFVLTGEPVYPAEVRPDGPETTAGGLIGQEPY